MITIRKAEQKDGEAISTLIRTIMQDEFAEEGLMQGYEDVSDVNGTYGGSRDLFLVAEKDGAIVGTIAVKEDGPDMALLRRVFVQRDQRGKGYGDTLLSEALDFCRKCGYRSITFRGTDRMKTAMRLCLKRGFEEDDVACLGDVNMVILQHLID